MGINGLLPALKPIAKQVHVRQYEGQRVAVDGYSWLHKGAYGCARELCEGIWTDRFVSYFVSRIKLLRTHGLEPIIVFDGGRLPIKGEEEESRRRARSEARDKAAAHMAAGNVAMAQECYQRCVDITPAMAKQVIEELKTHKVAFLVAPYEADAQMAYLARTGQVQLVVTEDSDLLAYGCPRVLYKLDRTGTAEELALADLPNCPRLPLSGWTSDQFLQLCIMAGCDFLAQLPGIGLKKAHGVLRKYRSFTKVVKMLRFNGTKVPPDYEARFQLALWAFRHARVYCTVEKAMIHLSPLPGGGIGGADVDVPAAVVQLAQQQQHERLDFLGPLLPPEVARGIAEGDLDPNTHKPYDLAAIYAGCHRPPAHLAAQLAPQQPSAADAYQPYSSSQAAAAFSGGGSKPRVGLSRRHAGQSSGGANNSRRYSAAGGGGGSGSGRQQQQSGAGKKRSSLGIAKYFQKPAAPPAAAAAAAAAGPSRTQQPMAAAAAAAAASHGGGGGGGAGGGGAAAPPAQGVTQSIAKALSTLGQHMQQRQQQQQADKQQLLQQLAEQRQQQQQAPGAFCDDVPPAKRHRSSSCSDDGVAVPDFAAADGDDADDAGGLGSMRMMQQPTASLDPSLGPSLDPSQLLGSASSLEPLSGPGLSQQGLGGSAAGPSQAGAGLGLLSSQPSFLCSSSDGLGGSQPMRGRGAVSALSALFHANTTGSQQHASMFGAAAGDGGPDVGGWGSAGGGAPSQLRVPGWGGQLLDSSSSDLGGSSLDGCGSSSGLSFSELPCGAYGAATAAVMDAAASASFGTADGCADEEAAGLGAGGGSSTEGFRRLQQCLRKGFTQPRQQQQPADPCTSGFFAQQQQQQQQWPGGTAARRRHSRFKEQLLHGSAASGGSDAAADLPDALAPAADVLVVLQDSQDDVPGGSLADDPEPQQQQTQPLHQVPPLQLSDSSEPSSTSNDENAEDAAALEQLGITHVRQYAKLAHKVVKTVAKQQQQHAPLAPRLGLLNTQAKQPQQQQQQHSQPPGAAAAGGGDGGGGRVRLQLGLSKASQQQRSSRKGSKARGAAGRGSFAAKLAGLRYDAGMFVALEDEAEVQQQEDQQLDQQQQQGAVFGRALPGAVSRAARKPFKAPWLGGAGDSPSLSDVLQTQGPAAGADDEEAAGFGAFGSFACADGAAVGPADRGGLPRKGAAFAWQ